MTIIHILFFEMLRAAATFSLISATKYSWYSNCEAVDNRGREIRNAGKADATFEKFQSLTQKNIYNTTTHVNLVGFLHDSCDALINNRYVGSNGSHARLIQGPKGIGKSFVLETFAEYCTQVYPNVLPVYLTFNDMRFKGDQLSQNTILEIIFDKMKKEGYRVEDHAKPREISHILKENNKYCLVLVDELDQLYRVTDSLAQIGHWHLGDLLFLGNQREGRIVVLLCGSSASCPLLVTCHADEKEFPLQRGAPHLNGTKYRTKRLPTEPFIYLETLSRLMSSSKDAVVDVKLARLIAFAVGMNARLIGSFVNELQHENSNEDIYGMWKAKEHESGLKMVKSESYSLYHELMEKFYQKNKVLINSLMENDELSVPKIMEIDWERRFQPLTQADVVDIWEKLLLSTGKASGSQHETLQHYLFELCDRDQLTFVGIKDGLPEILYPMNLSQVVLERRHPPWYNSFINIFNQKVKDLFNNVIDELPGVIVEKACDKLPQFKK